MGWGLQCVGNANDDTTVRRWRVPPGVSLWKVSVQPWLAV